MTGGSYHHRDDTEHTPLALHHFGNVRQVHFYAVLFLVNLLTHLFKLTRGIEFRIDCERKKEKRLDPDPYWCLVKPTDLSTTIKLNAIASKSQELAALRPELTFLIDFQVIEWSLVVCSGGERTADHVCMMGGAKDKHTLPRKP